MSELFKAMVTEDTFTENGMVTNSSSSNFVLDMFFKMGGSRGMSEREIENIFSLAYNENKSLALKSLFYNRDVRGGQGERRSFRIMFRWLCINNPIVATRLLKFVPEYGRWDDVFSAWGTPVEHIMIDFVLSALKSGDKLCAKWMPRDNKSQSTIAKFLMVAFGLSSRSYRKLITGNTQVVENLMCKNQWEKINYNHNPSKASHQYRDAFLRHDEDRYRTWLDNLSKPETGAKVNSGAIFPHNVIRPYFQGKPVDKLIEAQWKALPSYTTESNKVIAVCDVSGSMRGEPLEVCVALGIYVSERNEGIFKNGFITFSERPELQILNGATVNEKVRQLSTAKWDMNTNLEAVFTTILSSAIRGRVSEQDMPDTILIMSDMQFDACTRNPNQSAMKMIRSQYESAGYKVPNVVFWNLRTSNGVPAKFDSNGVALVSGFSPSILKSVLSGEMNPEKQMMAVLMSERYSQIN